MRKFFLRNRGEKAQGLTEYTLILVLVAIAALVALKLFGVQIKGLLTKATKDVAATTGSKVP